MFRKTGTLLTAALLGLTATVAMTGPALAAPADTVGGELSLSKLILNPTERGYRGSAELTVTNTGSESDYLYYKMREPVPGAFQFTDSDCDAFDQRVEQNRRVANCSSPDYATLEPGESFQVALNFDVLTDPRNYPMSMGGGWVEVYSVNQDEPVATRSFGALFRSTTGSLVRPRPYVQDTQPDAAIESVGPVTLDPEGSGNLLLPVTISYRGDAPHLSLDIKASPLPAGSLIQYTVPADGPVGSDRALVPGVRMMAGEVRSFGLLISPPTDPADAQNVITLELFTNWYGSNPDVDPSDNTAQTTLAVAATS